MKKSSLLLAGYRQDSRSILGQPPSQLEGISHLEAIQKFKKKIFGNCAKIDRLFVDFGNISSFVSTYS